MKLYIYIYEAGDRAYKLSINANSDEKAISLRDQLLSLYVNDASRLETMLQEKEIRDDGDARQSSREARIKEVQIYRERKDNLKLTKECILVGKEVEKNTQVLTVFLDNEQKDTFYLKTQDFPNYPQQVTAQIEALKKSLKLIACIDAYVAAFSREAGISQDPIHLELLHQSLLKHHFGVNYYVFDYLDKIVLDYLDKIHIEQFNSIQKRIYKIRIEKPYDSKLELPSNTWGMTALMFAVIRLSTLASFIKNTVDEAITRTCDLLEQGHNINAQDKYGRTPLMYVAVGYRYYKYGHAMPGREKLTRLLLENGADASLKDHLGKTALDYFTAEAGEEHPAIQLIRESLLRASEKNSDSIVAAGDRAFFQTEKEKKSISRKKSILSQSL